jgi:beta-glucanase (GH16 family)
MSPDWSLVFDDEFNGISLDTDAWSTNDGWTNQNNVTSYASNVSVANGDAILTLASGTSGAEMATQDFGLAVGDYAEARIEFSGDGTGVCNWPAWWVSGPSWPDGGETDIAEGLGTLTVNYHSSSGAHNQGTVPGDWAGAFHIYGLYRGPNYCDVYWDGTLVASYPTDDDGAPEKLILTMGAANILEFGVQGQMLVDYVRVWGPT